MGLDMYLYCNSRPLTKEIHEGKPYGDYISDWYEKTGLAIYWRKANAIHRWFVDNVQNGEDDRGTYEVGFEKLIELRDVCKKIIDECPLVDGRVSNGSTWSNGTWVHNFIDGKVLTNQELARQLLPTQEGFFFGGTDYDQYYYDDLSWTVEQVDKIAASLTSVQDHHWSYFVHPDEPDWYVTFTYHSSW